MSLSISVQLRAPSLRERLVSRMRRMIAWVVARMPYELPSYQRAREELGGVPWRRFEKTDAWFVGGSVEVRADPSIPVLLLDSVPELRTMKLSKNAWVLIAGAGLASLLLVLLAGRPAAVPPRPVAVVLPPVAPAPVVATPKAVPANVQSLFSAKKHPRAGKRHVVKARGRMMGT